SVASNQESCRPSPIMAGARSGYWRLGAFTVRLGREFPRFATVAASSPRPAFPGQRVNGYSSPSSPFARLCEKYTKVGGSAAYTGGGTLRPATARRNDDRGEVGERANDHRVGPCARNTRFPREPDGRSRGDARWRRRWASSRALRRLDGRV